MDRTPNPDEADPEFPREFGSNGEIGVVAEVQKGEFSGVHGF